jgi:hypothetical protein
MSDLRPDYSQYRCRGLQGCLGVFSAGETSGKASWNHIRISGRKVELIEKFKIGPKRFELMLNFSAQRGQFNHFVLAWIGSAYGQEKSLQTLFHDLLT